MSAANAAWQQARAALRDLRGAAAVEFAFIAPILFLLTLGMMEFGLILHDHHRLGEATRRGAREALIEDPLAQFTSLTSTGVQCQGVNTANVSCAGASITGASGNSFGVIYASMQGIVPTLTADQVYVSYADSAITDPAVTPGVITPMVTVEIRDFTHTYAFLDILPGMPGTLTLPNFSTTRVVHTLPQSN
jgi:Flp pilus assembly protein TadG